MDLAPDSNKHVIQVRQGRLKRNFDVDDDQFIVGRDESAQVRITVFDISRKHVLIRISGREVYLRDLGSANGTFVSGRRLKPDEEVMLGPDEEISLANVVYLTVHPKDVPQMEATNGEGLALSGFSSSTANLNQDSPLPGLSSFASPLSPQGLGHSDQKVTAVENIERIQAEAVRFAETLKDEARRAAEAMQKRAKAESEAIVSEKSRQIGMLNKEIATLEAKSREAKKLAEALDRECCELEVKQEQDQRIIKNLETTRGQLEHEVADASKRLEVVEADFRVKKFALDAKIRELEQSRAEAQQALQQAIQQCEDTTQESEKLKIEAESYVAKANEQFQNIDRNAQRTQQKLEFSQKELERLRVEIREADNTHERLKKQNEAAKLQITQLQAEMNEARELMDKEAVQRLDRLESEMATYREASLTRIESECGSVKTALEKEIALLKEQREREIAESQAKLESLRAAMIADEELIRKSRDEVEKLKVTLEKDKKDLETESRKYKTQIDSMDAEARVKRLTLDASLGEVEVKIVEAKRSLQETITLKSNLKSEIGEMKANQNREHEVARERLEKATSESQATEERISHGKAEIEYIQSEIQAQQTRLAEDKTRYEATRSQIATAETELNEARERLAQLKREADQEIADVETKIEAFKEESKRRVEEEIQILRSEALTSLDKESANKRTMLEQEFIAKSKEIEREVSAAKVRELEKVKLMEQEQEEAFRQKLKFLRAEIVRVAIDLSKEARLEEMEDDLSKSVQAILDGKTVGTISAKAAERTKLFWKKVGISASVPASIALIFVLFPNLPHAVTERINRTIASEKNEGSVFLDEIRLRGMKYQPEMDRRYRDSYSDNILYAEGYVQMKLDENEQKNWTLVLNDFFVGRLGLSDRILPDFMSAETVMVKDLLKIREGILPQFKEQGFARLAEREKQGAESILNLLQGQENYQKFRAFEKSFYDDYIRRKSNGKS